MGAASRRPTSETLSMTAAELLRQLSLLAGGPPTVHVNAGTNAAHGEARAEMMWGSAEEASEHIGPIVETIQARRKRHAMASALPRGCTPEGLVALLASSVGYTISPSTCPLVDLECIQCGWSMLESLAQSGPWRSARWAQNALGGRSSQGFYEAVRRADPTAPEGPDSDSLEYWSKALQGSTGGQLGVALDSNACEYNPSVASLAHRLVEASSNSY
jgi:hypothetical protein